MTKKVGVLLSAVLLGLALAGCGKSSVSVQDHSVAPSGMAAVIKGKTNQVLFATPSTVAVPKQQNRNLKATH
ncbi:hypothetical protein [Secundilactobacillus paracollinoides]|uniref:hypothetical protein n=1 Tax=Secundilactobacillus paracollinoides TaxID=240427 RepID=UPI0006D219F1|nr:hypothetical protein [Secundilactobacillus paracollinoides]